MIKQNKRNMDGYLMILNVSEKKVVHIQVAVVDIQFEINSQKNATFSCLIIH